MKPLVSVGLPVKNGFGNNSENKINISKSLQALQRQTYNNIEIIISNNCSTDSTKSFLEEKSKTDSRIKIFHQTKEISWAENFRFVLNHSNGKYFRWNAADDMISEDYIENNVNFLESNSDYISSSCKFFYENAPNMVNSFDLDKDLYNRLKGFFKYRHISHNILYSLVRRENMYKTIDIAKDYWAVDWIFDLDLLLIGKFKTLNKGYVVYGTGGMSRQKNFIRRDIYIKNKIYKILPFYELMKNLFLKTFFLKDLTFFEKVSIYFTSLKINFYFFKKHKI